MTRDPRFRHERVATLALVAAACALALYHDRALPAPLGPDAPASVFSEARASAFASSLDAPRLAGSDAEHAAFETLERALRAVAAETRAASSGRVVVDVLRTRHSGTFALRGPGVRETREQTMAYDRLDALAARVRIRVDSGATTTSEDGHPEDNARPPEVGSSSSERRGDDDDDGEKFSPEEPPRALLFSAHVDTVHVSPGGCDNAANVAIVLETFRAFSLGLAARRRSVSTDARVSSSNRTLQTTGEITPLVAMFVSAEEDGFMGARGVVRDHPWFLKHVAAFVNFEAMGSGGPHRAFRATRGGSSSELLRLYAKGAKGAKKPSGTVVASDVFSSGFIKSDTDFRVFRDDGDVPGIDLAFVEKTRVYHTPRDTLDELVKRRPGSMQASGSNALGLARAFLERSVTETDEKIHLKIPPGGVSTTSQSDVRRGAKNDETKKPVSKPPLTVWFDFPVLGAFVLFDVDGTQVAVALALVAVTSTARCFGARMKKEDGFFSFATRLAAIVVGVVGAFVAFAAAPVAGGLAALVTASATKTPVPWANSLGAFALCTMPYALATSAATLRLTRRCSNALWKSAAARRRANDDDASLASKDEPHFSDASLDASLLADADRAFSVSVALFLALLASFMFARELASAYLLAVPSTALFLRTVTKSWFAIAAPLAFSASLAFPTFFTLVDLAHGMTPRSRPPPGQSPYLYDIVCGVVAGGAVAATAFPTLAFLVSREFRRTSKTAEREKPRDSRRRFLSFLRHNAVLVVIVSVHAVALFAVVNTDYVSFTEQFPQQVSAFVSVASGNVSDAAITFLPAGPGSFEDAFARTLETLESFEDETSEASKKNGFRPLTKTCDTPATRDEGSFQRYDLASYSLQGSGACVLRFAALEEELAELTASSAIATEVRVTTGASRLVSGNARAVPITVDFKGMTRWVIAVDSRCAKRVAFAQGQDAEKEDAEAEKSDEASSRKNKRASPPVGPWRSTSRGRAGTGTGTLRYAAFGVGGRDARLNPRPITVWIETHDDISQFSLSGDEKNGTSVSEKCARDAMRIRADADFETATAMATRNASPAWVVPFAKHHTPLKLAVLAVAGLEQKRSDA